jgi:hypothetical protein
MAPGGCPPNDCTERSTSLPDNCGDQIVVYCGLDGDCNYQFFYDSLQGRTLIGRCVYLCGQNSLEYRWNPGRCKIVKTRHRVHNLVQGDEGYDEWCDEGTNGVHHWQVYIYDACTPTGTGYCREGPSVEWEDGGTRLETCDSEWWSGGHQ